MSALLMTSHETLPTFGWSFRFVLERADGVLSSAAVLRGCLGQPTPPLCRCAEYTASPLLPMWPVSRCRAIPNHNFSAWSVSSVARPSFSQPWHLACTAQRHKGGGRRPGDSRGAVHAKCQGEHRQSARLPAFAKKQTRSQPNPNSWHREYRITNRNTP